MSDNNGLNISRRRALAGIGAIGVASAGAGVGTSAYFSDTESFEGNQLTAGELDLKVDWEEHYYDGDASGSTGDSVPSLRQVSGSGDVAAGAVGLPDPTDPQVAVHATDLDAFMDATVLESGGPTDDPPTGVVNLSDVKPGDFGEVTLSYHLSGNPGYVRLSAEVLADDENGQTEPEEEVDDTTGAGSGELGEKVQAALWYDPDCDNVLDEETETVLKRGTLNEVMDFLGASGADPPLFDPTLSGGRVAEGYTGNCHAPTTGFEGDPFQCTERLYMTDTQDDPDQAPSDNEPFGSPSDDTTKLYEVEIDGNGNAVLTERFDFTGMADNDGDGAGDFNHVVSLAASADGDVIYAIDKFSKHLGRYDVGSGSFTDAGEISGAPDASLQAAVSPGGKLYFTAFGEDELYVINDPKNSTTVDETISLTDGNGDPIEVGGSDIVFLSDGTLFLIDGNVNDNTADLYKLSDPSTGNAQLVTELPEDVDLPGLSVRAAGDGNIIGSDSQNDQLYEIDPSDGSMVATYPMVESDGSGFDHQFGDMTVGPLCPEHCVALAWYVPRDVGNEIQSDTYSFDLTFETEQCRHNEEPFSS